ncbi:hypothetical protein PFISCL1PPCAC_28926, partial [Pristionchus fissidentatus]
AAAAAAAGMPAMPFPYPMMMQPQLPLSQPVSSPPSEADSSDRLASQVDSLALGSSATATPEKKVHEATEELKTESDKQWNGEEIHGGQNGDVSPSSEPSLVGEEMKGDEKRKSSLPEAAHDERTTNLIRKQMNEIEKEINRRAQNKNVKKIDDTGLAELIGTTSPPQFVAHFEAAAAAAQQEAALPFGAAAATAAAAPKESLNQLRNSFGLPPDSTIGVVPQQPAAVPAAAAAA